MNKESRLTAKATHDIITLLATNAFKVEELGQRIKISPTTLYSILERYRKDKRREPLVKELIESLLIPGIYKTKYKDLIKRRKSILND